MKCKKCGHRANDINAMRKHYMKNHPQAMKARGPRKARKSGNDDLFMAVAQAPVAIKTRIYHLLQGYFE